MPRSNPIRMAALWNAKYSGAQVKAILDVSLPNMINQEAVYFSDLNALEGKVRAAINSLGLTQDTLSYALALCRQAWKIVNNHTGLTMINELEAHLNGDWTVKGSLLAADCIGLVLAVFGIVIV
jgi:hypothetical protein